MQRFRATDGHRKCTVFLFYLSSHYHIYIFKSLCASRDDYFENLGYLQNDHFRLPSVALKRCMLKLPIECTVHVPIPCKLGMEWTLKQGPVLQNRSTVFR